MKYAQIRDSIVVELIPETDANFPDIPITERFSAEFLTSCEMVDDTVQVGYKKTDAGFEPVPAPDPVPITVEDYRIQALERISGKCSAAIYAGMDVTPSTARGEHHYSFPKLAQDDINQMMTSIAVSGETVLSYKADDESLNLYTADEIKVISKSLKTLGIVCTKYKEELEAWIARETDNTVLMSIGFGVKLPDDLTTSLSNYLTSLGIDAAAFMSMLV